MKLGSFSLFVLFFFPIRVFFHRHWRFTGYHSRGWEGTIFYSTIPLPLAYENLLATLHVRWLSRICNRDAYIYLIVTRWDLPPYWITIWLINDAMFVCLLDDLTLFLVFVTAVWLGKPVNLNSHRLSLLYYKRTD